MDKTVDKVLTLIEALAVSVRPRGVTELARELKLTKTNVHRLLQTLEKRGFVRRFADVGRYELTLRLWEQASRVPAFRNLKQEAGPFIAQLAQQTRETVHLSILEVFDVIYIDKIESSEPIRTYTQVGGRAPAYCNGTGKAMLAFKPPDYIQSLKGTLSKYTPTTITSIDALARELAKVRQNGYAINRGEWHEGVFGIAAPVRDAGGQVIAAIGISGPATRLKAKRVSAVIPNVIAAAEGISRSLGFLGTTAAQKPKSRNASSA